MTETAVAHSRKTLIAENVSNITFDLIHVTFSDDDGNGSVEGYVNVETGEIVCFPANGTLEQFKEHSDYVAISFGYSGLSRDSNPQFTGWTVAEGDLAQIPQVVRDIIADTAKALVAG